VALRPVLSNGLPFIEHGQNAAKHPPSQEFWFQTLTLVSQAMADEPRHLSELLNAGPVARILRESERRRLETARVRRLLPPDEAAHVVSAATNEAGELVLVMDTPGWAARVRYCLRALPGSEVKVRVVPRGA
jgi:hypothetical protein